MKKHLIDYVSLFVVAGSILILDQWTKTLVRMNFGFGETWSPWEWLAPYARIVNWRNTGAAFGMFQSLGKLFMILAILVSLAILYYYPQIPRRDWLFRLALGMQFAGATGNLVDRLVRGYVTDFISLGTFPVFNVADSSISIGVAIMVVGIWIRDINAKRKKLTSGGEVLSSNENPSKE